MVTDEMIRVALLAFQSGDMDWSSQDEELMRFALEEAFSAMPKPKPITHLVWLQGRRAADDVEDYYEVARPGDKSVDGSEPFPVYASPPALEAALSAAEPAKADCKFCKGSGVEFIVAGHGNINEEPCSTCGGTGKEGRHSICRDCDEIQSACKPFAFNVRIKGWGEEFLYTEDGAKSLIARLRRTKGQDGEVTITPLYAALSAQVQDVAGWQLVPVRPTEEMLDAYWGQTGESEAMRSRVQARAKMYYHVMLAAAPAKQEGGANE